jgi:transcription elongation factor Elf1
LNFKHGNINIIIIMELTNNSLTNTIVYSKIINHLKHNMLSNDVNDNILSMFFKNFCFAFDLDQFKSNQKWNKVTTKNYKKFIKGKKYCDFCGLVDHTSRTCKYENTFKKIYRLAIGKWTEIYISTFPCPRCHIYALNELDDNSPSLDIVCNNCHQQFEVKSKCLSLDILPPNIYLPHGNFDKFQERKEEGLDLIIVIYGADRISKTFFIQKILYINNENLQNQQKILITKSHTNNSSVINIPNIREFNQLDPTTLQLIYVN